MNRDSYIKTFHICGYDIDLGLDDYGQCYYIEWDDYGEKKSTSLGTYNFHYLEDIYYLLDPVYKILTHKDLWGEEMTLEEKEAWQDYQKIFEEEYSTYKEG